jgi:hypothetical protein
MYIRSVMKEIALSKTKREHKWLYEAIKKSHHKYHTIKKMFLNEKLLQSEKSRKWNL